MMTKCLGGFITFVIICAWVLSACGTPGSIPVQEISTATPAPPTGTLGAGTQSEVATPNPTESDEVDSATDDVATEVNAATPLPQPTLGPLSPIIVGTIDFPGEPLPAHAIAQGDHDPKPACRNPQLVHARGRDLVAARPKRVKVIVARVDQQPGEAGRERRGECDRGGFGSAHRVGDHTQGCASISSVIPACQSTARSGPTPCWCPYRDYRDENKTKK